MLRKHTDKVRTAQYAVPATDIDEWEGRLLSWSELESADREGSAQATVEHPMSPSTAQKLADLAAADPISLCLELSLYCSCIQHHIAGKSG